MSSKIEPEAEPTKAEPMAHKATDKKPKKESVPKATDNNKKDNKDTAKNDDKPKVTKGRKKKDVE